MSRAPSNRYSIELRGRTYAVHDRETATDVLKGFSTRSNAMHALADRIAREAMRRKMVDRPCLCCGATFRSEGIHNRLCALCRAGDQVEALSASLPSRRGRLS